MDAVLYNYVPRTCNIAAHFVASYAAKCGFRCTWNSSMPSWLCHGIDNDVNPSV
jgi:hypothetical protein